MAARSSAIPPAARAKGKRISGGSAGAYQPARLAATKKVAAAKPNSPRMDGAATGNSAMAVWSRGFPHSGGSPADLHPSVSVLNSPPDPWPFPARALPGPGQVSEPVSLLLPGRNACGVGPRHGSSLRGASRWDKADVRAGGCRHGLRPSSLPAGRNPRRPPAVPRGTIRTNHPGSAKCRVEGVRIQGESERSARSGEERRCDDAYSLVAAEMAADRTDLVPGRRSRSE